MDSQLSLAPAAGAGICKAMFAELLQDPEFPRVLATAARECLQATTPPRWDKNADDWTTGPDYRVRAQTLFGLLAQADGLPIQRIIRENVGPAAGFDLDAELQANPALADALRRKLDNAAWRKSGRNGRKVQPVEPEAKPEAAKP